MSVNDNKKLQKQLKDLRLKNRKKEREVKQLKREIYGKS